MDLYVWEGDSKWGLPSMDLKSLQMMAYVKFTGAPVTIHKSANPFCNTLPSFKCPEGTYTEFSNFSAYLRKQNYSCDYELSAKQCSDVIAYENLLKSKLYPAIMYLWWVEPKSYYDVIHKWFFKNIPFPYKFWYPGRFHKHNLQLITSLFDEPPDDEDQIIETELHKQAQECLTMLSHRLGDNEYFFGRTPSSIDALLFSYLALLFKVDLKVCVLQNHIKACPNLSRYVSKILLRYFPSDKKCDGGDTAAAAAIDDIPNKGRNLFLSCVVASSAMLSYAVATGLVQVDMGDGLNGSSANEYNYEEEEEDYDYQDSSQE